MSFAILLLFLGILSWQDIKEQKIYNIIPIVGIIIGFMGNIISDNSLYSIVIALLFGFFVLLVPFLLCRLFKKHEGIGFGDVLASTLLGAYLSVNEIYLSLIIAFLFALIFAAVFRKKKVPLIPFFTLGVILSSIIGVFYEIDILNFA